MIVLLFGLLSLDFAVVQIFLSLNFLLLEVLDLLSFLVFLFLERLSLVVKLEFLIVGLFLVFLRLNNLRI